MNPETRTALEEEEELEHDRSVVGLLKELRDEATVLFRQEVALAKAEISEKVRRMSRNAVALGVGAAVAYAGFVLFLFAASLAIAAAFVAAGLGPTVALCIGFAITAAVAGLVGLVLVRKAARTLREVRPVPEKTVETLEENRRWLKERIGR